MSELTIYFNNIHIACHELAYTYPWGRICVCQFMISNFNIWLTKDKLNSASKSRLFRHRVQICNALFTRLLLRRRHARLKRKEKKKRYQLVRHHQYRLKNLNFQFPASDLTLNIISFGRQEGEGRSRGRKEEAQKKMGGRRSSRSEY